MMDTLPRSLDHDCQIEVEAQMIKGYLKESRNVDDNAEEDDGQDVPKAQTSWELWGEGKVHETERRVKQAPKPQRCAAENYRM